MVTPSFILYLILFSYVAAWTRIDPESVWHVASAGLTFAQKGAIKVFLEFSTETGINCIFLNDFLTSPLVLCYDSAHFSPLVPMRHDSSQMQIIPITDFNRNLLPVHFVIDPGPDFSWWSDEEDTTMAARLAMTDGDKLALLSEYMDLVKMDVRRGSVKKTRPIRATQTPSAIDKSMTLQKSHAPFALFIYLFIPSAESSYADNIKGNTLESNQNSRHNSEKKRIFNEITQQFLRTFRLSNGKNKENGIDARMCAADLSRTSCLIASRLVSSSHEYMEEMVREYMRSARERFLSSKQVWKTT
ncbi:unnamed protein product [Heligmosomoides polygyrus]|uniref:Peptidase C76 domain-containing protein n=1 Tax=Heligmosomoides polygyrus TaxID=6339 RepID=A0A183F966_HELPZ|nr:unnamed protein product [Heligmosomoides polygyrus]